MEVVCGSEVVIANIEKKDACKAGNDRLVFDEKNLPFRFFVI
jgi:hypothetical protein